MTDKVRNPRFRYVDADDLENANADFNDLDVRNAAGDKLGTVDGFIVDAASERPYYVVVQSGGWFVGGRYLIPINHARLEHDARDNEDVLLVNLDKDTIKQYPKFDEDEFLQLSDDQLRDFETRLGQACCPGQVASTAWTYEAWEHYRQPQWWNDTRRRPVGAARPATTTRTAKPDIARTRPLPERILAQEGHPVRDRTIPGNVTGEIGEPGDYPERAEPGDVLGIESGGEETHLGDTAADERRRVEISDRDARRAEKNNRG